MINKNLITKVEPNLDDKVNGAAETVPSARPQTRSRATTAKPAFMEEVKSEAILDEPIALIKEKVNTMKDSDKEKAKKAKAKEKDKKDKAKKKEKSKKEKQKAKDKEKKKKAKKKAKKKDKEKKAKKKSKSKKKK